MFWNKRQTPQPEIRFIDDAPRQQAPTPPAPPTPPTPPTPPATPSKPIVDAKAKKRGGMGVILTTAAAVFVGGAYLKETGAFNDGAKERLTMPTQTFTVGESPTIVIDSFQGPVEVVRGAENRVEVEATKEARAKDEVRAKAELSRVTVTCVNDESNSKVTVNVTQSDLPKVGDSWASLKIVVPANSNVQINTANGPVTVTQVEGAITAKTTNGPIDINEAHGQLDLNTANGQIKIDGEDVQVHAQTTNGAIRFDGVLGEGESIMETRNGSVAIELPANQSFRIDAKTSNGKIRNDFRNIKYDTNGNAKGRLIGQVGNHPQTELKIRTSNGGIRLERD